mmetsp:Transcript_18062/g.39466  ORF Transcript_18062/g.39466 Transcript_18062/m.39466 type:complete len:250 (-) Transcript_18062:89-838(-)
MDGPKGSFNDTVLIASRDIFGDASSSTLLAALGLALVLEAVVEDPPEKISSILIFLGPVIPLLAPSTFVSITDFTCAADCKFLVVESLPILSIPAILSGGGGGRLKRPFTLTLSDVVSLSGGGGGGRLIPLRDFGNSVIDASTASRSAPTVEAFAVVSVSLDALNSLRVVLPLILIRPPAAVGEQEYTLYAPETTALDLLDLVALAPHRLRRRANFRLLLLLLTMALLLPPPFARKQTRSILKITRLLG